LRCRSEERGERGSGPFWAALSLGAWNFYTLISVVGEGKGAKYSSLTPFSHELSAFTTLLCSMAAVAQDLELQLIAH